jgi:hypothetical protein
LLLISSLTSVLNVTNLTAITPIGSKSLFEITAVYAPSSPSKKVLTLSLSLPSLPLFRDGNVYLEIIPPSEKHESFVDKLKAHIWVVAIVAGVLLAVGIAVFVLVRQRIAKGQYDRLK